MTAGTSLHYEHRKASAVRQLISRSGKERPNLLNPSTETVLETHSKYWIIDGFPTHTQDDEIIAEVRHLADLAGLSLADKELNRKLHRIPRKTGMNAVILILSQEFHFI